MNAHDFGGLTDLLGRIEALAYDPKTANEAAELTAAMLTVLGSGPAMAQIDALLAANQANGLMYHNAQGNQQRSNIIGMVATMNCVQTLLNPPH